jgi:hypothetical protein
MMIWVAYERDGTIWDDENIHVKQIHVKQIEAKVTKKQLRFSRQVPEIGYAAILERRRVLDEGACVGSHYRRSYLGTTREQALSRLLKRFQADLAAAKRSVIRLTESIAATKELLSEE